MEDAWIETYTGKKVYPTGINIDDIDILDIAHALSMLCRFTGHCREFYSVAEHSVRVCRLVPDEYKLSALLHDAAEAYLGDLSRPVKSAVDRFMWYEDQLMLVIHQRFGIKYVNFQSIVIKKADNVMLATEARDLMIWYEDWYLPEKPMDEVIFPWSQRKAEVLFLQEFWRWMSG